MPTSRRRPWRTSLESRATLAGMADMLQTAVVRLLTFASFVFVLAWLWHWLQIFRNTPVLGIPVDAAGRPIVHPANFDTFPYFTTAIVFALLAVVAWIVPDPAHLSKADMLLYTTLVTCVLVLGVWLGR